MKTNFTKLTIEVYKNGKLENTIHADKERVQEELIDDLLHSYFNKKRNITEVNYYNKLKVTYTEVVGKDRYKTIRIYE